MFTPYVAVSGIVTWSVVALVVVAWSLAILRQRRHRRRVAGAARSLGFNYHPHDRLDLAKRYHCLTVLREGHNRCVSDVVTGTTPAGSLSCFAYRYEVGFGAGRAIRRWLIGVIETDRDWGCLALRRAGSDPPDRIAWDAGGCDGSTVHMARQGGWAVLSRCHTAKVPAGLIDWLDGLEREACLELSGRFVALQTPLDRMEYQVPWMVEALQNATALLARIDESPVPMTVGAESIRPSPGDSP